MRSHCLPHFLLLFPSPSSPPRPQLISTSPTNTRAPISLQNHSEMCRAANSPAQVSASSPATTFAILGALILAILAARANGLSRSSSPPLPFVVSATRVHARPAGVHAVHRKTDGRAPEDRRQSADCAGPGLARTDVPGLSALRRSGGHARRVHGAGQHWAQMPSRTRDP
jgi:hypothetical protein